MNGRAFFGTNILVYIQQDSDEEKREKARLLFASRKLKQDTSTLKRIIHDYAEHLPVVQITPALIENAIDISVQTQISFWDSLILSALTALHSSLRSGGFDTVAYAPYSTTAAPCFAISFYMLTLQFIFQRLSVRNHLL